MTHTKQPFILYLLAGILLVAGLSAILSSYIKTIHASQPDYETAGTLTIRWGDNFSMLDGSVIEYSLFDEQGNEQTLLLSESIPMDLILSLNGKPVVVTGWLRRAGQPESKSIIQVASLSPDPKAQEGAGGKAPSVVGSQPWVSVLCKFKDIAAEPKIPAYFQNMYGSSFPGLDHYWRELSYDLMNIVGSLGVSHWHTLPQNRNYYVYDSDSDGEVELDFTRATNDCTGVADPDVLYTTYVGINMMFNADLDGYAWGGSRWLTLDGTTRIWYTTWEPPWGYDDITVISHEMGHGFGLPHSSAQYGNTYDNEWDVMSDTWSNCARLTDATYGCLGQHTISYHKDLEGWIAVDKKYIVNVGNQTTLTLERLALPQTVNYLMAKVPIGGSSSHFYTVEARLNVDTGYDVKLSKPGIIIHEVDTSRVRSAQVVDGDNDGDPHDDGPQWVVGETFNDAVNHIWVSVDSANASGFVVTINNNAVGPTKTATLTPTITTTPTITSTPTPTFTQTSTPTRSATPTQTCTPTPYPVNHRLYLPVLIK